MRVVIKMRTNIIVMAIGAETNSRLIKLTDTKTIPNYSGNQFIV